MPVCKTNQEKAQRFNKQITTYNKTVFGCYALTPSRSAVVGRPGGGGTSGAQPVRKSVCLKKTWHRTLYKHWHLSNQHIHNNTTTTTKKKTPKTTTLRSTTILIPLAVVALSTYRLKCSRIRSSRIFSGKFPTQRWRVSLTILLRTLHGDALRSFHRQNYVRTQHNKTLRDRTTHYSSASTHYSTASDVTMAGSEPKPS